jgi:PleD family two-component response regulator
MMHPDTRSDDLNRAPGRPPVDPATLRAARVVIVDDQESNVTLLERMLDQAGYVNVASTTDSSQAVELCARTSPDLVLLDLLMPEPDGFEVMEGLQPLVEQGWFPILVLTADVSPDAMRRALASGAKDFVTKPFDRIEVLLRIENLLEARFMQLALSRGEPSADQGPS